MDDQQGTGGKGRWRLPTYETERAQKWGRGALIVGALGALAMLTGTGAGALFVLGGIGAHLAARRIDRGLGPMPPLGELAQWRPSTTKDQVGLGLAALLAVGGIASIGSDPAPGTTAPQGIADQELVTATDERPAATVEPEATNTPRPTRPPATATDEPEPTATLEPPTAVPPTEPPPPPTAVQVVEPTVPPPPPEPQPAARTRGGPQGSACPADLPVKGNQGSNGWIYHDFSSPNYERTEPEECFATAADAEAAGYRAPRR